MKILWIVLIFWLSINLISCKSNKGVSKPVSDTYTGTITEPDLVLGEVQKAIQIKNILGKKLFWVQTLYNNDTKAVPSTKRAYIVFHEKEKLSIQSICNKGAGTYSLNEKSIQIQASMMTRVACKEATIEYNYFKDLNASSMAFQIGNKIFIDLKGHKGTMEFELAE